MTINWRIISLLAFAAILFFSIWGCAETRYLSKEEDDELRTVCEPAGGCAVIPRPVWQKIEQLLGGMRGS